MRNQIAGVETAGKVSMESQSVEEFTDYDSVVVFLHVARAYIAKFFVTSH